MKSETKAKKAPASKNTAAYWQQKVFRDEKRVTVDNSKSKDSHWVSAHYYARIQVGEERRKIRLKSTTSAEAGKEAANIYREISATGWQPRKTKKRDVTTSSSDPSSKENSVGSWIESATSHAKVEKRTVKKYAESLRTIVGDILGISGSRKKETRRKIDEFLLDDLTTEKIRAWLLNRAESNNKDTIQTRRANNTARTLLVNARSLFTSAIQESMEIPADKHHNPFKAIKLPRKSTVRYTSKFDARLLLDKAENDLSGKYVGEDSASKFEQWKILYLALVAGLRYREIDNLRKQDVSTSTRKISVLSHGEYTPKTQASEAEVTVSEGAAKVLEQMWSRTEGEYFVTEARSIKSSSYRTGVHHDKLLKWLRNYEERGFKPLADVHKPLHELRKEAGTLVNSQHGLNEAKNFLRHSDISTTAAYYVGSKGEITTGLS